MNDTTHWYIVEAAKMATPLVLGLITFLIARGQVLSSKRQAATAEAKLKWELFEKRFEIYNAFDTYIASLLQNSASVPSEEFAQINRTLRRARFLFAPDLCAWLDGVRFTAINLAIESDGLNNGGLTSEERMRSAQARYDHQKSLVQAQLEIGEKFASYLDVGLLR